MPVGRIPARLTEANDKPLALDVRFWADRAKTVEVALTGAQAWLNEIDGEGYLAMTVANGRIVIDGNTAQIRVPAEDMATVAAGNYALEIQGVDGAGGVHELRGEMTVLAGLAEL